MTDIAKLKKLAKLVRYYILRMTTKAGSGHPTSSLSAADLMVALFFDKLRFDLENPNNLFNDKVIFSKGHASPLLYALYGAARPQRLSDSDGGQAGVLSEKEIDTYRQFGSPLEGHPNPRFKYVDVATGSLGQGLSIGLGMALALRAQFQLSTFNFQIIPRVYVLMGDSETAEGSVWEAIELASYYKVGNLIGIIDVNRLGQRGETMLGWDIKEYQRRVEAFGWQAHIVDGHSMEAILKVFSSLPADTDIPQMIIAKTIKGKGVSFLENKDDWHGKALSEEEFEKAVAELGEIAKTIKGVIEKPKESKANLINPKPGLSTYPKPGLSSYQLGEEVATRKAYGEALAKLGEINPAIIALDAEVKNSTFAQIFESKFPNRFFEMFIAEQNMVGVAQGFSKYGFIPFVSTFGVFFTRAFDQIRMAAYSNPNIKFVGSHTGVSIGEDGPSQMALEDIAMFRAILESFIFCPADAVSCAKLVEIASQVPGLFYIRCARPKTPVIYQNNEKFEIGGSKIVRQSKEDKLTIIACGVALLEAVKAADELSAQNINVRVIDAYSIKPIDEQTLKKAAGETGGTIITVEDHYQEGGLGDAVLNVFAQSNNVKIYKLAIFKMPFSAKPEELFNYEGISKDSIIQRVKTLLK